MAVMADTDNNPDFENPFGVETDLVKKTIIVTDKSTKEEFEFRIPTIADEVALGTRMRRLRRAIDPMDDGSGQLDGDTMAYLRAMAYFEVLLKSTSATDWVYTKTADGKQYVDSTTFPPDKANIILFVAGSLYSRVQTFRFGGITN